VAGARGHARPAPRARSVQRRVRRGARAREARGVHARAVSGLGAPRSAEPGAAAACAPRARRCSRGRTAWWLVHPAAAVVEDARVAS